MIDLVVMNLVASALAATMTLWLRPRPLALVPSALVLTQIVLIQLWVLITGLVGSLDLACWRIVCAVLTVGVLAIWAVRPVGLVNELRIWQKRLQRSLLGLGSVRAFLLVLVGAGLAVWVGLIGHLVGPYLGDVTGYHLVPPTDWIADRAITRKSWPDDRAWWPQGEGLIATWWMLPTRTIHAAVWAQLHWLMMIAAAVWGLARQWGGSVRAAATAVCLIVAIPIIPAQAVSALNDVLISVLILTGFAALASARRSNIGVAVMALVLGLGVKPTMLMALPALLGLMTWRIWQRIRQPAPYEWRVNWAWLAIIAITIVTSGYWFARNNAVWGHPLYPAVVTVDAEKPIQFEGSMSHTQPASVGKAVANMRDMVTDKMWDRRVISDGQGTASSGFGAVAAVFGPAAMLGLLVVLPRSRPVIFAALLTTLATSLGIDDDEWKGRFYSYLPLIWIVCVPLVTFRLRPRILAYCWIALLIPAIAWSIWVSAYASVPRRIDWRDQGFFRVRYEQLLNTPYNYVIQSLRQIPQDTTLIVLAPEKLGPFAMLHGDDLQRRLRYETTLPDRELVNQWRRDGLRWVCLLVPDYKLTDNDRAVRASGLIRAHEGVYEIR